MAIAIIILIAIAIMIMIIVVVVLGVVVRGDGAVPNQSARHWDNELLALFFWASTMVRRGESASIDVHLSFFRL